MNTLTAVNMPNSMTAIRVHNLRFVSRKSRKTEYKLLTVYRVRLTQ
jgi:hypothetical protein